MIRIVKVSSQHSQSHRKGSKNTRRRQSRLSQRQWLNIIILAISAFILIFAVIGKMFSNQVSEQEARENSSISKVYNTLT